MNIFTLSADEPLVKAFDAYDVSPYPMAYKFTSTKHSVNTIEDLHKLITATAKTKSCLIKGTLNRDLNDESRAGSTVTSDPTQWVCFDLDKVENYKTPDMFMKDIGLGDVSYVVQYSSSFGIEIEGVPYDQRLSCHIFCMMDRPMSAPVVKEWLKHLNFTTDKLRSDLQLTKTKCALSWPLDITTCQNDKLLYIAPPTCKGGAKDVLGAKRIQIVIRKKPHFSVPDFPGPEKNRIEQERLINLLRADEGLHTRRNSTSLKTHKKGTSYLDNPGEAVVTDIKEARGYVYLNLNGGNSWGYYHPEDDFEFIHNFKGEPTYLTKQLLPEYFEQKSKQDYLEKVVHEGARELPDGRVVFAFREKESDSYYNGVLFQDGFLDLHKTGSKDKLSDFLAQYNLTLPGIIEDWSIRYSPVTKERYSLEDKWVNTYCPGEVPEVKGSWSTIEALLVHALGASSKNDPLLAHFINWLAFIYQTGELTKTAWLFQGTQGTGKGTLFSHVFSPLLGRENTKIQTADVLEGQYTEFLKGTQLLLIDEMEVDEIATGRNVANKLKSWIVEDMVRIREMYAAPQWHNNFCNWLLFTNSNTPLYLDDQDRRFNIGYYQKKPLRDVVQVGEEYFGTLGAELPAFAYHLANLQLDERAARTPMETEAKKELKKLVATNTDEAFAALAEGDIHYFWSQIPDNMAFASASMQQLYDVAEDALKWITRHAEGSRGTPREIIQPLVEMVKGERFRSPSQFSRLLGKHHMPVVVMQNPETKKSARSVEIDWKIDEDAKAMAHVPTSVTTKPAAEPAAKPAARKRTPAAAKNK